jgi:hypothetical protein
MLKRLIIAVFVMGLILSFSGTAFSDVDGKAKPADMDKWTGTNTSAPRYNNMASHDSRPAISLVRAIPGDPTEFTVLSSPVGKPITPPSGYFCDVLDNSGGWGLAYGLPGGGGTRTSLAERFSSEVATQCTIKGAYVYPYFFISGTPDLMVFLYDDNGFGLPGAKLDSVLVPYACLADTLCTFYPDFAGDPDFKEVHVLFTNGPWVFDEVESWHIAVESRGVGAMTILGDDGVGEPSVGLGLGSVYTTTIPGWTPATAFFPGTDRNWAIMAERCCGDQPFSDCHTLSYWGSPAYTWDIPNQTYGDDSVGGLFSVTGPETLKSVDVYLDPGTTPGVTMYVTIHDANLLHPNPGTVLASVAVPYSSFSFYPAATNVDFSSFNLVFESDFYVTVSTNGGAGSYILIWSDDEFSATNRGIDHYAGTWYTNLGTWGGDFDYMIDANLCKDEFAVCNTYNDLYDDLWSQLRLPRENYNGVASAVGDTVKAYAQKFSGTGENCSIRQVGIYFSWAGTADLGRTLYDSTVHVRLYSDAGGLPGANLGGMDITAADFVAAGNIGYNAGVAYIFYVDMDWTSLGLSVGGDYWIVLTSDAKTFGVGGTRPLADLDGSGTSSLLTNAYQNNTGWHNSVFGSPTYDAGTLFIDVKQCCIPFAEYTCVTPQDWSTPAGNFQRTGRTDVSLSDAYCDLNYRWTYEHPTQGILFCGPVVYKGRLAQIWSGTLTQFDLLTGAINWTKTGAPQLGTNMRCTPTAATLGGVDVLFTAGGGAQSVTKWDWNTGAVIWNRPGPNGSGGGSARWGVFSLATQGADDVLYTCSETGKVVAINAATGVNYAGWGTNPVSLSAAASEVTNTYNPTNNLLYVGQAPASGMGDLVALDAATGAIVWQLSISGPGLRGAVLYTGTAATCPEVFSAHVSYEAGFVYANSRMNVGTNSAFFPADGIYYKINAATGAIVHAAKSGRLYRGTPIIDQNNIILPCISVWATPPLGAGIIAFSKAFGVATWINLVPSGGAYWLPGLLTCEPGGDPDQLYAMSQSGFLSAYNANTGAEEWNRRMEYGQVGGAGFRGFGVALSEDGELAVSHEWGGISVLAKGGDRPRMEFISYNMGGGVNFGTNPALPMNLGWFMKNTGCLPLNIQATAVDAVSPSGQGIPAYSKPEVVGDNLLNSSAVIAEKMTANGWGDKLFRVADVHDGNVASLDKTSRRETLNRAALSAPPAWFVSLDNPGVGDVILPGDSVELEITVNQNFITRGPNAAYLTYTSDDEDFFVNDTTLDPEALINLVGGCLTDTTDLKFGMGAANYEHVWNMGRIGDGDAVPAHGFHIDGNDASYFGGSYIYSVSQRRYAASSNNWSGDPWEWISLQADPNWCDTTCHPLLVSPYAVPAISTDGLTYTPITASMVCRNYLDSVQNFDDGGGGWTVELTNAPFDNDSTMGLYVKSRVIGATNEAGLANVTIDLMEVSERNGNAVPNWYFGSYNDYDIGGTDTSGIDKSVSTSWAWNKAAATGYWGQIKLPFGCGQTPIVNTHGMQGAQALYTPDFYFDSQYVHMTRVAAHTSTIVTGGDFEQHNTFVKHDFTPNESFSYGIAHFGYPNAAHGGSGNTANATIKNLANLVNKWTGWGRGDVNNDNVINLADVVYLAGTVNFAGPGAIPFAHLGDVDASGGAPNQADVNYLINFYFSCGPCPAGAWTM